MGKKIWPETAKFRGSYVHLKLECYYGHGSTEMVMIILRGCAHLAKIPLGMGFRLLPAQVTGLDCNVFPGSGSL